MNAFAVAYQQNNMRIVWLIREALRLNEFANAHVETAQPIVYTSDADEFGNTEIIEIFEPEPTASGNMDVIEICSSETDSCSDTEIENSQTEEFTLDAIDHSLAFIEYIPRRGSIISDMWP